MAICAWSLDTSVLGLLAGFAFEKMWSREMEGGRLIGRLKGILLMSLGNGAWNERAFIGVWSQALYDSLPWVTHSLGQLSSHLLKRKE